MRSKTRAGIFVLVGWGVLCATAEQSSAALWLKLKASDFSGTTWTDSSGLGHNATATGFSNPTLVTNATPNGSSAVQFNAGFGGWMSFADVDLTTASGFTILAFAGSPSGGPLVANTTGALEYRFRPGSDANARKQSLLATAVVEYGISNTALAANAFGSVNVAGTIGATANFRLNGVADGTINVGTPPGASGNQSVNKIAGGFGGQIAEIQIWNEVLTLGQIQAIEAQFITSYVTTAVPEPTSIGAAIVAGAAASLARRRRTGAR